MLNPDVDDIMNYKKHRRTSKVNPLTVWSYKKGFVLDYLLKKQFKKDKKVILQNNSSLTTE